VGGGYRLRAVIAEGGAARVYDAVDSDRGRDVAIKLLKLECRSDDATRRLRREGHIASALEHPNICRVIELGALEDDTPFLVMERLHGLSLAAHLASAGALNAREAVSVVVQIASALASAHAHGIIHRDVKPPNVFLSRSSGRPLNAKLLDFGSAT